MSDQNLNEDLNETEGIRNQREKIKELERQLAAQAEEIARRDQEAAERAAAERAGQVANAFQAAGVPEQMASLYPQDAEVNADAVANWAQSHGVAPQPRNIEQETDLDRINRLTANAWNNADEVSATARRIIDGVYDAHKRNTRPSQKEIEEAEKDVEFVNRQNALLEKAVNEGRAKPFGDNGMYAYGGRVAPPPWADKAAQARAKI